jgi:hypothetical protein
MGRPMRPRPMRLTVGCGKSASERCNSFDEVREAIVTLEKQAEQFAQEAENYGAGERKAERQAVSGRPESGRSDEPAEA